MALRGAAPRLSYVVGYNVGAGDLVPGSEKRAALEACVDATAFLGERIFQDFHVDAFAPTAAAWGKVLDGYAALVAGRNSSCRVMILESNAWPPSGADHALARGVGHGAYANVAQRRAGRVVVNGYANGLQAWQGLDDGPWGRLFSQGSLLIQPNGTVATAAGQVFRMLSDSYAPRVLTTNPGWEGGEGEADALALASESGGRIVLRIANWASSALEVNVTLLSAGQPSPAWWAAAGTVLDGTALPADPAEQNSPGEPRRGAPRDARLPARPLRGSLQLTLPALSYSVVTLRRLGPATMSAQGAGDSSDRW